MKKYRTTKMAKGGKTPMKSAVKKMAIGGKVDPKAKMIDDEIKATRVVSAAVPTRKDLEQAYKANFKSGADGTVSFEDFIKKGVDAGDLKKLTSAASGAAGARQSAQTKKMSPAEIFNVRKSRIQTGESLGSSVRPGSDQGEIDADESNRQAVNSATMAILKKMGYKG